MLVIICALTAFAALLLSWRQIRRDVFCPRSILALLTFANTGIAPLYWVASGKWREFGDFDAFASLTYQYLFFSIAFFSAFLVGERLVALVRSPDADSIKNKISAMIASKGWQRGELLVIGAGLLGLLGVYAGSGISLDEIARNRMALSAVSGTRLTTVYFLLSYFWVGWSFVITRRLLTGHVSEKRTFCYIFIFVMGLLPFGQRGRILQLFMYVSIYVYYVARNDVRIRQIARKYIPLLVLLPFVFVVLGAARKTWTLEESVSFGERIVAGVSRYNFVMEIMTLYQPGELRGQVVRSRAIGADGLSIQAQVWADILGVDSSLIGYTIRGSAISTSIFGDMYMEGGMSAVIIAGLLAGILMNLLHKLILRKLPFLIPYFVSHFVFGPIHGGVPSFVSVTRNVLILPFCLQLFAVIFLKNKK